MSGHRGADHGGGAGAATRGAGGPAWWATLTDEAARDEIEANRRAERHVAFAGVAGLVVTVLVILVVLAGR